MGLNCSRYCINEVEKVCTECDHYVESKHGDEMELEDQMMDKLMRDAEHYICWHCGHPDHSCTCEIDINLPAHETNMEGEQS